LFIEGVTSTILNVPLNKHSPALGDRQLTVASHLYLERTDFRTTDDPNYFGMAPGKLIVLKYFAAVRCVGFEVNEHGQVTHVKGRIEELSPEQRKKIKGIINLVCELGHLHWIAKDDALEAEVHEYN
jgi:glutaminyl-tRNA synthetase